MMSSLNSYLDDYEETTLKLYKKESQLPSVMQIAEKVSWNPFTTYHMVARFLQYIQPWVGSGISNDNPTRKRIKYYLRTVYKTSEGPSQEDFKSAVFAFINIHYVYNLTAKDISEGYIDGVATDMILSADDCFLIGKHAIKLKYFTLGIEWLERALYLTKHGGDQTIEQEKVNIELITSAILHDEEHAKTNGYEPKFFNKPLQTVSEPRWRIPRKFIQYAAFKTMRESNFVEINFWGVCEGLPHQSDKEKSELFCWYERKIHPSFQISPVKAEIHSMFPKLEVVQYHDIIDDDTIEYLKNVTYHKFIRAGTKSANPMGTIDAIKRQSSHGWISENVSQRVMGVSKLVERLTGLQVVGTQREDLQLATYTTGSYYSVHTDASKPEEGSIGFRMATFMFYFSDVEKGGDTAFVQSGVKVSPKKGSAVFWYNTYSSGILDPYTWHGACPVMFGEKWVANKWIHYSRQQHLKCGLSPEMPIEVLVNGESKYSNQVLSML